MTSTTFIPGTTITSAWLNDVNTQTYGGTGGSIGTPFIQSGTGAIARTVQDKARESVSVLDFGASPAASGAVNRTAFVAAMAASSVVFVPAGTYAIAGATIVIPDNSRFYGAGPYATIINFTTSSDVDCFQIGWYTAMEEMTVNAMYALAGSNGTLRLQSLTNAQIPTNVGGNNWTTALIGGLSYKNILKNLVLSGGQNYNIYGLNIAYTTFQNVRAVLGHNASGNVYIWGKGGVNMPVSTTLTVIDCEFTASYAGPGFNALNLSQSLLSNMKCEGNYGRGILLNTCQQIKIQTPYVENNFALGAAIGDGDIVCISCTQVSIQDGYILSSNSANAVTATSSVNCTMGNTGFYLLGGGVATLNLDSGFTFGLNAFGVYNSGVQSGGRWVQYADGTSIYSKKVTLSAIAITAGVGSNFVQPSPQADTDFPAIFMSDGASGFVFSASITVMSDSAAYLWVTGNGASKVNNAIRYRLASGVSIASATVDVYITLTGRWK